MTNTRDKLLEARYFLERMKELQSERVSFRYNLSAFLSAARSVTFVMQKEFKKVPKFDEWYKNKEEEMKRDKTMKFLLEQRNIAVKEKLANPRRHTKISIICGITVTPSVSTVTKHSDGTVEIEESTTSINCPKYPSESMEEIKDLWFFRDIPGDKHVTPDDDVITVCEEHIFKLEKLVDECEFLYT